MRNSLTIRIVADKRSARRCQRSVKLLSRLLLENPCQLPLEIVERFFHFGDLGGKLIRFDVDHARASRAGDVRACFRMTNFYRQLLSALRTGDRQFFVV